MALFGFRKKEKDKKQEVAKEKRESKEVEKEVEENGQAADEKAETPKSSRPEKTVMASTSTNYAAVLIRPRITEKATLAGERGAYVFDVATWATKTQIREAVQHYYKLAPRKVNVVTIPQKRVRSRMRGRFGVIASGKKAYVYLEKGDSIEVI